jgi:hypothetical protein
LPPPPRHVFFSRCCCRSAWQAQEPATCGLSAPRRHLCTCQRPVALAPQQDHHVAPSYPERYRNGVLSGYHPGVFPCKCPPGTECCSRAESGLCVLLLCTGSVPQLLAKASRRQVLPGADTFALIKKKKKEKSGTTPIEYTIVPMMPFLLTVTNSVPSVQLGSRCFRFHALAFHPF